MENKNNNKGVITLLIVIIVILAVLCVLLATGTVSLKSKTTNSENKTTESQENVQEQNNVANNLTIVIDENPNNNDGYTKTISTTNGDETLYVNSKEIKIGNKQLLKLDDDAEYLNQVSVYDNLIITEQNFSLGCSMIIYDFSGNILKTITLFSDEQGRVFNVYPRYSESEYFNVSDNGTISFLGTKHTQGAANSYINNSGDTIDLCTQGGNINNNEIVSGIFEMTYLGNNSFSDVTYVSTKTTVKDIKSCN